MVLKKKSKPGRMLTDVELELMNVIWTLGECTVKEVQEKLLSKRELAYTSVATVMKILEQKHFLTSVKKDKAHTYKVLLSKTEYEATAFSSIAQNLFEGDSATMVMKLLDSTDLSSEELQSIQKMIKERLHT